MDTTITLTDINTLYAVAGGALGIIGALSLFAFVLRRKLGLSAVMALHMLNLMVVLCALLIIFQPKGTLIGAVCIIALLSLFRMFSQFENTDKR